MTLRTFYIDDLTCAIDGLSPEAIAIRRGLNMAKPFQHIYNVADATTCYVQAIADTISPPPLAMPDVPDDGSA